MADGWRSRERYGEAFWRAHHEAWQRSELNQREYCEAQGISLKAFGNWRAKFQAEPRPAARKLLYRRGGLSHPLSHSLSHPLSHMTYPSSPLPEIVVLPAREGHRLWHRPACFESLEAATDGTSVRYGADHRCAACFGTR